MYNQVSPTFSATEPLIRDYENKALFWFLLGDKSHRISGGCLDHALAIEFAREARCLALLDVQKKPLN
ncbi:unnamed protein product, partial [Rotaria sp. Silwood2]